MSGPAESFDSQTELDPSAPTRRTSPPDIEAAPARSPAAETSRTGSEPAPASPPSDAASSPDSLTGHSLLGRYVVGRKLGSGGFGAVYQASDEWKRSGGEDSEIAIKVLEKDKIGDRLDVLIQEVSRSHQVSHPNILRVFELQIDGGLAFIAMELLRGQTLKQRIAEADASARTGKTLLPLEEIDDIAEQICDALAYCHDQMLVHADIKPENIFLCDDGTVKLLDLGISQIIGTPGRIRGYSASYGSPQQKLGGSPDPTDDIFSLGCVLYECLTGNQAQPARSRSGDTQTFRAPDYAELPRRYRRPIESALQPEREERADSAAELWDRISPDIRRRNLILGFLALVMVTGLVAAVVTGRIWGREDVSVPPEAQRAAKELYQRAVNVESANPGMARELLVEALELDPYLDDAGRRIADQVRSVSYLDGVSYSLVWQDFAAALAAAPASESLMDAAEEIADALLEVDPVRLGLSRGDTLSRFRAPLCVLPNAHHRTQELDQLRVDLRIRC